MNKVFISGVFAALFSAGASADGHVGFMGHGFEMHGSGLGVPGSPSLASQLPPRIPVIPANAVNVNSSTNCRGGGTSAKSGSYDPANGNISISIKVSACNNGFGSINDGTVTASGTIVADTTTKTNYNINVTYVFNTKFTDYRGGTNQRSCTWVKNGVFDTIADTFNGTFTKSNCVVTANHTVRGNIFDQTLLEAQTPE